MCQQIPAQSTGLLIQTLHVFCSYVLSGQGSVCNTYINKVLLVHGWIRLHLVKGEEFSEGSDVALGHGLAEKRRHPPGGNCIKIGLPGKLILSKRKGLREIILS